jgi:hypothetical protein
MSDLLQSAQLFEVSSRLQSASTSLSALADGRQLDDAQKNALRWAGAFLSQVDWASRAQSRESIVDRFAVQATAARPTFYEALVSLFPDFRRLGIASPERVTGFLSKLYTVLLEGGDKALGIKSDRLRLAAELLEWLSQSMLDQLTDNGVPKETPLLSSGSIV